MLQKLYYGCNCQDQKDVLVKLLKCFPDWDFFSLPKIISELATNSTATTLIFCLNKKPSQLSQSVLVRPNGLRMTLLSVYQFNPFLPLFIWLITVPFTHSRDYSHLIKLHLTLVSWFLFSNFFINKSADCSYLLLLSCCGSEDW